MAARRTHPIRWFDELGIRDVPLVGGKNASLGELYRHLTPKGVAVPNGFAVTAAAYFAFLKETGLDRQIRSLFRDLNTHDVRNLAAHGRAVRSAILKVPLPPWLRESIAESYHKLEKEYGKNVDVAVRSSATAEDLPDASFAGQQETYLNIRGVPALLEACRKCFASLFTDRAISYRADKHFSHFKVGLSIGVQKMVRSDRASSGVLFTLDTESGFRDVVIINSSYGLGENIVQGSVSPDEFIVHKPTLAKGFRSIISRTLGTKRKKMIYATHGGQGSEVEGRTTKNIPVRRADRARFSLTDREALILARWGVVIEKHYHKPMDMEWAKDGITGKLFIVQARPETVQSRRDPTVLESYHLGKKSRVLVTGVPVGSKIGAGKANVIRDVRQIAQFRKGQVLVTKMTDPDWEPIMKIAAAIVTDEGGRTCHAAIVSRELGIPCIVGTDHGSKRIRSGQPVTISCAEGDIGKVYSGVLPFTVHRTNLKMVKRPKTHIKMIFGTPELAFTSAQIPNEGVGLAREEFIINSYIKIHPLALYHFAKLKDPEAKRMIEQLTLGYTNKKQYYIDKLASGIGTIAAAFYPKEVIVRLADFRSNEYAELIGGRQFEPDERNPMIGWRGASRYYDPAYRPAFDMECKALKKVREEMGLTNVKIMVPFCRTVEEGKRVIKVMAENGLKQHVRGLEVYVMCEIPSNVVLAEQFADVFDGFSIGSNDLTQLTLGLDRDSAIISHVANENNEAVKRLIAQVIAAAKKAKRPIGICGQAPSDFPEFARFLVRLGIDSISLNPDTILPTTVAIAREEAKLRRK